MEEFGKVCISQISIIQARRSQSRRVSVNRVMVRKGHDGENKDSYRDPVELNSYKIYCWEFVKCSYI